MKAKNFKLPDQNGKIQKLSDYKGKWVVLYFYPRDNTPGCTKEACNFRDSTNKFTSKDTIILGVSKDSVKSHKKFSDKYRLNFPILSDEDIKVIKAYDAWGEKKFMGRVFEGTIRKSFLIDPSGNIKKIYPKVNPLTHAEKIFEDLSKLQIK